LLVVDFRRHALLVQQVPMSAISRNRDVQTPAGSPELTAPLVSPQIESSFAALFDGRCSLSELSRSVLEACSSDPDATDGILLQIEAYVASGEFDRFDLGPLQHVLQEIRHRTLESGTGAQQESNAGSAPSHPGFDPTRHLPSCDTNPTMPGRDLEQIDEHSREQIDEHLSDGYVEPDHCPDDPALAPGAGPNVLRGRYVLAAEIGQGGVGTVYRALDLNRAGLPREHQYVALKVLRAETARRPEAVQALRREYHQAQLLSHPGIVNVFDFDHEGDLYFVTMELLDGESLGALTRRVRPNKLPPETAIRILRELGDAVAYAHDRGVLHLDLKPDNVMIDAEGHVRVLDFGLAQKHTEPWLSEMHASPAAATPAYASCERLVQERPDVRDDIYSFCCIAYELLTGKHPFDRRSALHARKEGLEARRIKWLSHRQWDALRSGLAWAREDRPASMQELLQGLALQSRVTPQTAPTGTMRRMAVALGLLVLGIAAMLSWVRMHDGMRASVDDGVTAGGRQNLARTATTPGPAGAMSREPAEPITPEPVAEATAAPSTPNPTPNVEFANVIADTRPPPLDARSETSDLNPARTRRRESPSHPRKIARADQIPSHAPRPTPAADVLGFSRHSVPISEADSVARVDVRRTGSATGDISFQWYTVADSATAVQDFVYEFGEERMAPGQTTATLVVPIVADRIHEDPELLRVVLANPHGARVGPAGRVPVIIVDDD
jgi:serine/threonine protein kinase